MQRLLKAYRSTGNLVSAYWRAYGGFRTILVSPYFHLSVGLTILTYSKWSATGWWTTPIEVLPSLLGFTLGGYAILLAFGDEKFRQVISGSVTEGRSSPFITMNATFLHFLILQILALGYALVIEGFPEVMLSVILSPASVCVAGIVAGALGYFLFLYSLCMSLAAVLAIYRFAGWYDQWVTMQAPKK